MRFVKLQVAVLLVAAVAVVGLGADLVLKNRAENELATQVMARVPQTSGVRAKIRSFPFVGRLARSGEIAQLDVMAQHSGAGDLSLNEILVKVEGVEMDTGAAMRGRAVVRSIKRGSVRADLRQNEINSRLPKQFQVELQQGAAVVSGPGGSQAKLTVSPEGAIRLSIGERPLLDLPLPNTALLPCRPEATFVPGAIRLVCTFDEVPPLLLDLAQR